MDDQRSQRAPEAPPSSFRARFRQQALGALHPSLTPLRAALCYALYVALCCAIAVAAMPSVPFERRIAYGDDCPAGSNCTLAFAVPGDLAPPVYVYYELTHFFHNALIYTNSRNWPQLRGEAYATEADLSSCAPIVHDADSVILVPCGAVALSVFTDSFEFSVDFPPVLRNGLVPARYHAQFAPPNPIYNGSDDWLDREIFPGGQTDERFASWMRGSAFPTLRKLWGRTEETAFAGQYSVTVHSRWQASGFGGQKTLVIAQVGRMAIANWAISGLMFALAGAALLAGAYCAVSYYRKLHHRAGVSELSSSLID
jgi:hypothetical protein